MKPYYQHGGVTLYHADCREVLPGLTADALVTDPPYGIAWSRGTWDEDPATYPDLMRWLVAEAKRGVSGWCFVFQASQYVARFHEWFPEGWRLFAACKNFARVHPTGIWQSWDPVVFWNNGPKGEPNNPSVNRDYFVGNVAGAFGENSPHPCPKPIDTMRYMVQLAAPVDGLIVDPFAGSGTTLLAAKQTYRRAVGVEVNEEYCEIIARRLSQEVLPLEVAA